MLEHIGDILEASFCQDDIKYRSHLPKIARMFLLPSARRPKFVPNSVPTASLPGVRTLCQQQNQGRCWHSKLANSRYWRSNVRTKTLVGCTGCHELYTTLHTHGGHEPTIGLGWLGWGREFRALRLDRMASLQRVAQPQKSLYKGYTYTMTASTFYGEGVNPFPAAC